MLSANKRARRKKTKQERPQSFSDLMKCVLYTLPFTVLMGALLLSFCTALLLCTDDPDRHHAIIGTLLLYLDAAFGGMLATRFYGKRAPFLCGLFHGLLLALLFTVPALFWHGSTHALSLIGRLMIPLASLLGACVTSKKRNHKLRHRRR